MSSYHPTPNCPACGISLIDHGPQESTDECGAEFGCYNCLADLYDQCWPTSEAGIYLIKRGTL